MFIGRTDVEAETPILWPPDVKSWLIWKDPDAGKDWGKEEKGTTEDEVVECHHQLSRHGFGWTPGVGDGQGGLACCDSWGRKESDMTEQLNWTEDCIIKRKISRALYLALYFQGKPDVLQSMGSQRVGHNWMTTLNYTLQSSFKCIFSYDFWKWLKIYIKEKGSLSMCDFPKAACPWDIELGWNVGLQTPRFFLLVSIASNMEVPMCESDGSSLDIRKIKTHVYAHMHVTFIEDLLILDIWIA